MSKGLIITPYTTIEELEVFIEAAGKRRDQQLEDELSAPMKLLYDNIMKLLDKTQEDSFVLSAHENMLRTTEVMKQHQIVFHLILDLASTMRSLRAHLAVLRPRLKELDATTSEIAKGALQTLKLAHAAEQEALSKARREAGGGSENLN